MIVVRQCDKFYNERSLLYSLTRIRKPLKQFNLRLTSNRLSIDEQVLRIAGKELRFAKQVFCIDEQVFFIAEQVFRIAAQSVPHC